MVEKPFEDEVKWKVSSNVHMDMFPELEASDSGKTEYAPRTNIS